MTRQLNLWLAVLLLIIGLPFYWYVIDSGTGDGRAKPVTMTQLRALARSMPGPLPVELRYETLAKGDVARNALAAGSGVRPAPIVLRAFQLIVPGEKPIVIDAGTSEEIAQRNEFEEFDHAARGRIQHAVANARMLLLQNAMPLRNGGLPSGRTPPGTMEMLPGHGPRAVAPGVVLLPMPGLDPGATLIYAQLADGRELLFAGAIARLDVSWREVRPPARFVTRNLGADYRPELMAWLMTINALHRQAPQMVIVTSTEPEPVPFSQRAFSD